MKKSVATLDLGLRRGIAFWVASFVLFFVLIFLFREILLPFVVGMATAYFLDPVCDYLEGRGMSRTWATAIVTLVFALLVALLILLLVPALIGQIVSLLEQLPKYIEIIRTQLEALAERARSTLDPGIARQVRGLAVGSADRVVAWVTDAAGGLVAGGFALANLLSLLLITPVVAFYLLRDWDRLVERVDNWLPRDHAETIRAQVREVDRTLAGFVRGQATVCALLGTFYGVALTVAGLDFGLVTGLLAGLLSFIPYIGALTGAVASIGLALLQFDDPVRILVVAAVFGVGQAVEGNYLTPKLVGGRVGLHAVWVIFALLAGGALFGFVGVLLAVPVAAVIGVLIRFSLSLYLDSDIYRGAGGDGAVATDTAKPADE